jgi:Fur family transcriptional regulator, zinc uptake regulator
MSIDAHQHRGHESCAHAGRQAARAPEALVRAESVCCARGARLTPLRRRVLEILYGTYRPLGAYEIADALPLEDGRRPAPVTIYRALEFLLEHGLVHRLASRNAFIPCPHGHGPRDLVAFLICERCDGVDELSSAGLTEAVSQALAGERFESHLQVLEISGTCAHCRGHA